MSGGGGGEITYMGKQLQKTSSGGSVCSSESHSFKPGIDTRI